MTYDPDKYNCPTCKQPTTLVMYNGQFDAWICFFNTCPDKGRILGIKKISLPPKREW